MTDLPIRRRIHRLPDTVVNRIAAGEVVERPASVVKELVENALDAGARSVLVEIEQGGTALIRVVDDGVGMSPDDARLAVERHATSKIESERDLDTIATFGFRGEALPSIESVSRFCLRTRPRDAEAGLEIRSEGGVGRVERQVAMPPGTEVEVADLFGNVPARRKFLKSERSEAAHVAEVVRALALAHPHARVTLRSGGRTVLDLAPDASLEARVRAVVGGEAAAGMTPLDHQGRLRLSGMLGRPDDTRRSSAGIVLFVNRRWVRDRLLQRAVADGYGTLLERGTWPVVVLFLDLDPAAVDVNVHPTKAEVRFRESAHVFSEVRAAVMARLREAPWLGDAAADAGWATPAAPAWPGALRQGGGGGYVAAGYGAAFRRPLPKPSDSLLPEPTLPLATGEGGSAEPGAAARGFFASLHYVGQVGGTFLVCETAGALVLIDQHAAHERVTFERLRTSRAAGGVQTQRLLLPARVELPPDLAPIVEDHVELLASLGVALRPFGDQSFVVEEVPALLARAALAPLLRDLADELRATGGQRALDDRIDALLSRVACHASIRGGEAVSREEARALLEALDTVDFRAACPHGRPIVTSHSFDEVATWFHRG